MIDTTTVTASVVELPLVCTAADVAAVNQWFTRTDPPRPRTEKVRDLVRQNRFPQPIDPCEPVHLWRWSRSDVERYAAGEWQPSVPSIVLSYGQGAA